MDLGLTGKVALVPAASQGLGRAVAQAFAREGAQVVLSSRDADAVEQVAEGIRRQGGQALAMACDVTRPEDVTAFVNAAVERFGGIDVLVTNAGGPPAGTFGMLNDAQWQAAFELTLMSAVRLIRTTLPSMRSRGGGSIVCMTSSSVKQPIGNLLLSNVIRSGVAALAKSLADELAPDNIRVNQVIPGRIATARVEHLDRVTAEQQGVPVEQVRERMTAAIPMRRYGTAEEFADAVVFLASERASYITGATLQVDGGAIRGVM